MEQDNRNPQPGDLIEIDRPFHQHWALYMGDGYVIHVTDVDERAPSLSGGSDTRHMRKAKVKKELLREVVGNDKSCVINKYDSDHPPLPVDEIIWHAESCVGMELTYDVSKFKSVDFLSKLRHVGLFRAFEGCEIHHRDQISRKYLPIPGDLIEISLGHYKHWAIYVGRGYVIHVTDLDEGAPSLSGGSDTRHMRKAKVKKELLREVARTRKWCVSNEYDCHLPPLPVDEIIWHAEGCVGIDLIYDVSKFKSVDILRKLRHVGLFRAFEGGEIHRRDLINRNYLPIPGDLIEIFLGHYEHWAIYVGRGYVIHVTDLDRTGASSGSVSSAFGEVVVKKELLEKVVRKDEWCVNNKYDKNWNPFPVKEIIWRAEGWVGEKVPYRLFWNNCEHFVTKLRYGEAVSDQAMMTLGSTNMIATAVGVASLISLFSVPGVPFLAIAGAGTILGSGSAYNIIAHIRICAKFKKAGRDILEKSCC
ncbi:uncharacterized protein LOC130256690 [Oenanthe melanoleuca]|uniref:uncharacterized protein LOC130256690 n=1 Tax=Oenanthe melanoleuca TaxID=2939378 RepID=UPI0024C1C0DF|nr:uncharacterized protein LOC130256690 [Oenanthe melanoleuca]